MFKVKNQSGGECYQTVDVRRNWWVICDDVKKKSTHTDFWLSDLLICILFILEYVYICVCAYMLYEISFIHIG